MKRILVLWALSSGAVFAQTPVITQILNNYGLINPGTVAAAVERVAGSVRNIRRGEYKPQPSAEKCTRCDFRRVCRHTASRAE